MIQKFVEKLLFFLLYFKIMEFGGYRGEYIIIFFLYRLISAYEDEQWTFPDGFVIGASTASHQIEGAWNISGIYNRNLIDYNIYIFAVKYIYVNSKVKEKVFGIDSLMPDRIKLKTGPMLMLLVIHIISTKMISK